VSDPPAYDAQTAYALAQEQWFDAIQLHRTAPPDAGFSARIAGLAAAAHAEAGACRLAHHAGYEWPPHRSMTANVPYELTPGSGRRGPEELWAAFDQAVVDLTRAGSGSNLLIVADAYEAFGHTTDRLAEAVEREDLASGLISRVRGRRGA
jgi:hypothetical protein